MQTEKRHADTGVIQELLEAPQRYRFVQAVRLLLRWLAQQGVPYDQALKHVLRFRNSLSLRFPAGEIESLRLAQAGDDTLPQALRPGDGLQIHLVPACMGLLGIKGGLPLHMTERIADSERKHGDGARAFADLFTHRMTAMFFQAWGKYRLEHHLDTGGKDGQLPLLLALSGVSGQEATAAYYAGLLRCRPVSASTVSRVLSEHFGVPIELVQLVGGWEDIPHHKLAKLGGPNARIGHGATLGRRLWRHDRNARLDIGPLGPHDLERFLPRRTASAALLRLLSMFGLSRLRFEARLLLRPDCIKPVVLGAGRRLGWDTFLLGRNGGVSRNWIGYRLTEA